MKFKEVSEVLIKDDCVVFNYKKDAEGVYCSNQSPIEALKWARKRINAELDKLYKEVKEDIKNSVQRRIKCH